MQKIFRRFIQSIFLVFFVIQFTELRSEVPVPALSARVIDQTSTLTEAEIGELSQKCKIIEERDGTQIAILMVQSTEGEAIEEFSYRVASTWELGQKGKDNGLLIVIAKQDHRIRIEVGYGLEGRVTDVLSKRIIRSIITPFFKNDQYYRGLDEGIDALSELISPIPGEPIPKHRPPLKKETKEFPSALLFTALLMGLFFTDMIGIPVFFTSLGYGSIVSVVLLWLEMVGFIGAIFSGIAGCIVFLILYFMGKSGSLPFFSSSSSYGSSHSGDFFSGGGGSFGGGGASGDW
ncbi:MAG: TPM domain-containing protein [Leptospiraceae bacterium]|nr:TPM domain-containing protein [Leptospiraceae bacterium]MCP5510680.1 TPM domain-containing protein [Leptospiraceae bacterium]